MVWLPLRLGTQLRPTLRSWIFYQGGTLTPANLLRQLLDQSVKDARAVCVNLTEEPLRSEGNADEVTTVGKARSTIALHSLEPVGQDQ